jgi:hypothetical protein
MAAPAWWADIKHFRPSEFDSPDAPGSGAINMHEPFVRALDAARAAAGIPFIITSGYRSPAHNAAVGGAADSDHTRGWCADVACYTKTDRARIDSAAVKAGILQRAFGDRIVHLGSDPLRAEMVGIYHPGEPGRWY